MYAVQLWLSHVMDLFRRVPPALPKVFLVRNYVCAVHKLRPDGAVGGGRTANQCSDPLIFRYYAWTKLVWARCWLYWPASYSTW